MIFAPVIRRGECSAQGEEGWAFMNASCVLSKISQPPWHTKQLSELWWEVCSCVLIVLTHKFVLREYFAEWTWDGGI